MTTDQELPHDWLQQFQLMNILVQTQNNAHEPKISLNFLAEAFVLFYFITIVQLSLHYAFHCNTRCEMKCDISVQNIEQRS